MKTTIKETKFYTPFHAWLDTLSHMEHEYELTNPPFEEDEEGTRPTSATPATLLDAARDAARFARQDAAVRTTATGSG